MMDVGKLKRREVVLALLQIIIALLISLNCAYIFSYRYDPGPRSTAYKQTWLYTAYPSVATIPLILANALVILHRHSFPVVLGVVAGSFCIGVFIATFNLVFTCCSMAFFISIGLLHLLASSLIVIPLAFCSDNSPFSKRDFKLVPESIPPSVKQFLPRVKSKRVDEREKLSGRKRGNRRRRSGSGKTLNSSVRTKALKTRTISSSDKTVFSSIL